MMHLQLNPFKARTLLCVLLTASPVMVVAAVNDTGSNETAGSNEVYVDSVYSWGAWDFDIQPAAGGVSAPTGRPLIARPARMPVNVNSTAAISPAIIAPTVIAPPDAISSGIITTLTGTGVAPVSPTTAIPPGTSGIFN